MEAVVQVLGGGPESLSSAELDGRDGDMHGVDEVRRQELPNGGNAAPEPYILPTSGVLGPLQRLRGCGVEEVERGVGQREAGSVMVGKDEHGGVEGRGVSPPALPLEVLPRATLGSELVAAHDLGADVASEVASEVVVQPSGSAGLGAVRPTRRGEGPRGEVGRVGVSEGPFEALAFTGAEPVYRHAEVLHSEQLRHSLIPSRCATNALAVEDSHEETFDIDEARRLGGDNPSSPDVENASPAPSLARRSRPGCAI